MRAKFSRGGISNAFGKHTAEFPKFKAPEDIHEGAESLAREAGMSLAEWLRVLVTVRVIGVERYNTIQAERIKVVVGTGEVGGENHAH